MDIQRFVMKQFKYQRLGSKAIYDPVRGAVYFDENAEMKKQHHVGVNETRYGISCKQNKLFSRKQYNQAS